MRKPDFFVVGAAKSGTTALWKIFQQHPEIFVTTKNEEKELGYYTHQYGLTNEEKYLSHFINAHPNQLIGEVCHAYLTSEESAQWIKQEIPNAKIIIILRNPIDRAYSLYNWMIMHGYESARTFNAALKNENKILEGKYDKRRLLHKYRQNYYYINTGFYFEQVERYYHVFGKENVLVLDFMELKTELNEQLYNLSLFLKIDSFNSFNGTIINKSHRLIDVTVQHYCRRILLSKYGKYPFVNNTIKQVMLLNKINRSPKKIDALLRKKLYLKYKDDIIKLSDLTDIPFDKKWQINDV